MQRPLIHGRSLGSLVAIIMLAGACSSDGGETAEPATADAVEEFAR